MSVRDIIEAAKAVHGAWFTLGRGAATDTCDLSVMPQAYLDYLRLVCDPAHISLMEAVCEAAADEPEADPVKCYEWEVRLLSAVGNLAAYRATEAKA